MKSLFVPMNVLIIEIRILVEPHGQAQCGPAAGFIHDDLATLKFALGRSRKATARPNRASSFSSREFVVGPKNCPGLAELRSLKEVGGISCGKIIGIQEEHLAKA